MAHHGQAFSQSESACDEERHAWEEHPLFFFGER
jgi:hypothetical protein